MQKSLVIIKPDAVSAGQTGEVIKMFSDKGFKIVAMKMLQLDVEQARGFYVVHKERPFYDSLVKFMTSGPVVVMCIEGADESIITQIRDFMGATNPADAAEGTIRKKLATSIERNVVHGSDSVESTAYEIPFFFDEAEFVNQ